MDTRILPAQSFAAPAPAQPDPVVVTPRYYAEIDSAGRCIGVTQSAGELKGDNLVCIDGLDTTLLGKVRVDAAWSPAPPPVAPVVTMRQARLALLSIGLLDDVEAAIDALPSPQKQAARIEWEYSGTVERNRPLIAALAPALGLDDAGLDALFFAAAAIP